MKKYYKINERIKAQQLRVITESGENLGVLDRRQALNEAHKRELDLILISEGANPPIAKILDFNKFLYEERKKESKSKAKSKKSTLKELRLGPMIDEGDLNTRISRAKQFIKDGNQIKVTVQMKGRENAHPELGIEKIEALAKGIEEEARMESPPTRRGRNIIAVFVKK